jgi:serine protease Do
MKRRIVTPTVLALAAVTIAACGSSSPLVTSKKSTTSDPPTAQTSPATTEPPGSIQSFSDIQPAVIQIEARGTIRSPEVGLTDGSGRGSGFIISSDGIAVTNNHVVTGAATLQVFIGGDTSKSYNAKVLGVSECDDLAVIDINESAVLPALKWNSEPLKVGTDVYAAGFPLGEPQYTMTKGIIAKTSSSGDTSWASLDSVLEHDANIQPGNSGGPLVAADGTVIGINYKGRDVTGTTQFYAIDKDIAQKVVEKLKLGDFESIGINGEAVVDEEKGISGIWISGVAPGSPASTLGILPGDIIQSMNGLPVGTDGTMSAYCDVLRTSGSKPIKIEVLRFDTSEILAGELNNPNKPLVQTFSFAAAVEDNVTVDTTPAGPATNSTSYTTLTDDTKALSIDVPSTWTDVSTTPFKADDGTQVALILASTNLASYDAGYTAPGLLFAAFPAAVDATGVIGQFAPVAGDCTDGGIKDFSENGYTGKYQLWSDCGGTKAFVVTLAASPASNAYTAVLSLKGTSDVDLDALDHAFSSFTVKAG